MDIIESVKRLKASYKKLPGIGDKTAERLAYATLGFSEGEKQEFIDAFKQAAEQVHVCPICGMYIDTPFCPICDDKMRDDKTLIVVTSYKDVLSFEKTDKYHGKYFVLGGSLSPIKGIGPEIIRIPELKKLVVEKGINEVILACNSTMEGETTSLYINKYLADTHTMITRLAYGLPVGADLEYVDEQTIERSFASRTKIKESE